MPNIDLSILNQRQTPAFYADVFANRPAAGFIGRIFVSTNTFAFYRDNGTSWDLIGGPGTGTVTGTGANGQVTFWNGASTITGSNDLFFDAVNGHLGVNTNAPGTALDVHHDQSTVLQLQQTVATNDTRIAFINSGAAKWRVGNFYSGGSHDYKVNDAALNINRFTIKSSSGQTFVGDETSSSGLFVVNSNSGDAHIVALGATAPSIRVRNAGVGASLQFGLGLATTTNNFIQGATGGEFCIFNDSLTAQPILFGIRDAGLGNTQEAARISAARNFLIGTTTDAGQKLQVSGNASISGNINAANGSFSGTGFFGGATNVDNLLKLQLTTTGSGTQTYIGVNKNNSYGLLIGYSEVVSSVGSYIRNVTADPMFFVVNNTTTALTLQSTGAATFNSSVTTNGGGFIGSMSTTQTPALIIDRSSTGFNGIIKFTTAGVDKWILGNRNTSDETFKLYNYNVAADVITVTNSGNLLIGKTTDTGARLQVNGKVEITAPSSSTMQTVVGYKTAVASGSATTIAYVGYTNAIKVYLYVIQDAAHGSTAVGDITTYYGSSNGGITLQSNLGNVTNVAMNYNNSGYVLQVTVTYTGAAPTIYWTIEGLNNDANIYAL